MSYRKSGHNSDSIRLEAARYVGKTFLPDSDQAMTFSAWVHKNFITSSSTYGTILSQIETDGSFLGFRWLANTTEQVIQAYNNTGSTPFLDVRSAFPASGIQEWNHLAITKASGSRAASAYKFYLNGVEVPSPTVNVDSLSVSWLSSTTIVRVGGGGGTGGGGGDAVSTGKLKNIICFASEL